MTGRALLLLAASVAAAFLGHRPANAAEYRLRTGDVLEISVAGAPDLRQRAPVGLDGSVSLPLIGEVEAAGRSVADLRAEVRTKVARKEFRQRATSTRGVEPDAIAPDEVTLTIAEYRPVYLNGDVAKPGEYRFQPGLTVRKALSLAGGYDILRFRMQNPFLEAAELRGAYESAWIDYAREDARLSRVRSELKSGTGQDGNAEAPEGRPVPVDRAVLAEIRSTEAQTLKERLDDERKQRTHLTSLLAQNDVNIATLVRRHDTEESGTSYDEEEFKRIEDLYRKGTLPMVRVAEARRVMLLSATQALQSGAELERAKTEREATRRQLEALGGGRRIELLAMEQEGQTKLAAIRARIQAISEKMLYTGALRTQLARGTGGTPDLVLFRDGTGGPVGLDTELQPGDVVEVALRIEDATGGAAVGQ